MIEKLLLFLVPFVAGQAATTGSCAHPELPYQRRTLFPHLYDSDCPTMAKTLTIIMGQRKCAKKWVNFHKLRGTWCEKDTDGTADPTGIGATNCMYELKRRGTELSDGELLIYCRTYMKLKCDGALN